jgi:hypothetical protein
MLLVRDLPEETRNPKSKFETHSKCHRPKPESVVAAGGLAVKTSYLIALLAAAVAVCAPAAVLAGDLEQRAFSVTLDGKPAGDCRMSIQKTNDGSQLMAEQMAFSEQRGSSTWRYSYRALETWKGGRLQKFESYSEEDGQKRHVVAARIERSIRVNLNDRRHDVDAEAWTNSYWFIPTAAQRTQLVVLFDIDTGKESTGTIEFLGSARRPVAGADAECAHHRVRAGALSADLWFDGSERLVRRESSRDGHKIVLELLKLQK